MTATPRPWEASSSRDYWKGGALVIRNSEGRVIAVMTRTDSAKDDRDMIVRAVNMHDELVAALTAMCDLRHLTDIAPETVGRAMAVLRKAEEGE